MIEKLKVGDVVIATHPFMLDRHVIARVEAEPTKAMVRLAYYVARRQTWENDARRKIEAVEWFVPSGVDLFKLSERLISAHNEVAASERRARQTYIKTIASLVDPTPPAKGE